MKRTPIISTDCLESITNRTVRECIRLGIESGKPSSYFMNQYVEFYKQIEKSHEDCYGMMKSFRYTTPIICMDCIANKATDRLVEEYGNK